MILYPNPQYVGSPDSPPAELLHAHVSELTPRHAKMCAAIRAARNAKEALAEFGPPAGGVLTRGGSLWVAAQQRNVEAITTGEPVTAVADVIRAHPTGSDSPTPPQRSRSRPSRRGTGTPAAT